MKYIYGTLVLVFLVYLVDDLAARIPDWYRRRRRERDEFMRNETLNRYSMGAFKAVSKDWRQS